MFRDQTGLSVTPALWSSIEAALDGSDWFVLLASPDAAGSMWVNREIAHWVATKPAERILPVLTDGHWAWDSATGDFTADSTAVPAELRGVFAEEPLYLDLRWAREDTQLSLQHARFRDAIAQLAAPMHGLSKDELEGEDVRQHVRVRRVRGAAVTVLAGLTIALALAGGLAARNAARATEAAAEARRQQQVAVQQHGNAEKSAEQARLEQARAQQAKAETLQQQKLAKQQLALAKRASADASAQATNARRQKALADDAAADAHRQQILARQAAARATAQQRAAEKQRALATQWAAKARQQEQLAQEQEKLAQQATADAHQQQLKADEQQRIAIAKRLINKANVVVGDDPKTALMLGLAAHKIDPDDDTRRAVAQCHED